MRERPLLLLSFIFFTALAVVSALYFRQPAAPAATSAALPASPTPTITVTPAPTRTPLPVTPPVAATLAPQLLNAGVAAELLAALPQYASEFSVVITELEAQPRRTLFAENSFTSRTFLLRANGRTPDLINFVGHLRATAPTSIRIEDLQLVTGDDGDPDQLSLFLIMTTSPDGAARLQTPTSPPSPTPLPPTATLPPTSTPTPEITPTPTPQLHVVQTGENLFRIAREYDVTLSALREVNDLTDNNIVPGQTLIIP